MNKEEVIQVLTENIVAEFEVTSLGDYCDVIDMVSEAWRKKIAQRQAQNKDPAPFYAGELSPWFRGVRKKTYNPEPLLFRFYQKSIHEQFKKVEDFGIDKVESYLFQRFKTFGMPYLDKIPKDDIEWHFLMRHHNVPSRLLDWSKGSFIGLYFATRKTLDALDPLSHPCDSSDSAVWMLEPRRLNEICTGSRNIYGANKQQHREIINDYLYPKQDDSIPVYPLPIIPDLVAPRIEAHIGRFTFHTLRDANLDFNSGGLMRFARSTHESDGLSYLVKIVIPHDAHFSIARSLRSTGVSDMNFSQDLDGLSQELTLRVHIGRTEHNRLLETIEEG